MPDTIIATHERESVAKDSLSISPSDSSTPSITTDVKEPLSLKPDDGSNSRKWLMDTLETVANAKRNGVSIGERIAALEGVLSHSNNLDGTYQALQMLLGSTAKHKENREQANPKEMAKELNRLSEVKATQRSQPPKTDRENITESLARGDDPKKVLELAQNYSYDSSKTGDLQRIRDTFADCYAAHLHGKGQEPDLIARRLQEMLPDIKTHKIDYEAVVERVAKAAPSNSISSVEPAQEKGDKTTPAKSVQPDKPSTSDDKAGYDQITRYLDRS